jgi:HEAT repeat protein
VILVFLRELTIKTDVNRKEVVQLVGLFKDRRATKTLCQIATSGNREERDAAFSALVELRDPDAVPLLRSICRSANQWTDRREALRVLSKTIGSAALEEQLALLRSPDKLAREAAAHALRDTADASTLPTLIAMLPDPNPEIRLAVVGAMVNVVDPLSTEALVFATRDADLEVRRLATTLLHNRQGEAVEGALLAVLQSSGDTKLLSKALWGLVNQRSQAAIEPLCRLVLSNSDPELRAQIIQGLGRYAREDKRVQATLAVVSKDTNPKVRRLAASLQRK